MIKDIVKKIIITYFKILSYIKLRFRFNGQIIGVAGCFGKSSAVNILEEILKTEYEIYTTNKDGKGLNSETGIPFALLNITPKGYSFFDWIKYMVLGLKNLFTKLDQEVLVLEMGVDKPNDMKFLVSFIKPNVGILINSNNTHSQGFKKMHITTNQPYEDLIAYENGYIFEEATNAIIYNNDDPEVIKQIERFKGEKKIPFSISNSSNIETWQVNLKGTDLGINYQGKIYRVRIPYVLLDEYKNTIQMALKVADYYKIKPKNLIKALENITLPPSRLGLFEGINNTYILDSSYNSSYVPCVSALELLNNLSQGRKIAVLGDMRELGDLTEKEHRKLAHSAKKNCDIVITVGPSMKKFFYDEFIKIKEKNQIIYSFIDTKDALNLLSENNFKFLKPKDMCLIKGSQNTLFLESIVEKLLRDKEDVEKLCRRGNFWEEKRKELLNSQS